MGEFLGLDWQRVSTERADIRITLQGHAGEVRMPDTLFSLSNDVWLTPASLPVQPLSVWEAMKLGAPIDLIDPLLPVIYGDINFQENLPSDDYRYQSTTSFSHRVCLPIDIFGSAFFMLTRYEELVKPDRDEHDRFPANASLSFQERFLMRPIIDEYVEVLWVAMQILWPNLKRRKHIYKLIPTHDVDRPFGVTGENRGLVFRRLGGDMLRRKSLIMASRRAASFLMPGQIGDWLDPNNTFDWIMDQSERHGLQSVFYFIAGKSSNYENGYDLISSRIQRLLDRIHQRGHIIGLHPSYGTLGRSDLLSLEADNLRRAIDTAGVKQELQSSRQHYLRWHAKRTWADLERAGIKQDSSVGFAQNVGFRAGTCRSYSAWSWQEGKPIRLTEQPLIAMEGSLLFKKYMAVPLSTLREQLRILSNITKLYGGNFVILWHNDAVMGLKGLYKEVLNETV